MAVVSIPALSSLAAWNSEGTPRGQGMRLKRVFGNEAPDTWDLLAAQVTFEIADITSCELAPESYDVVYSRDTILHIHDKPALFER